MAGGKGKSSGGKSSGGKVGADGSKKQQSHSSKAGLQVSKQCANAFSAFADDLECGTMYIDRWIDLDCHISAPQCRVTYDKQQGARA
jgi:hypothetical protein